MDERSFMQESGVAWWGHNTKAGICQCCQKAKPVYEGYNGGAHMHVEACSVCRQPGHPNCNA